MAAHTITVTSHRELWWTRYRWRCTCGRKSTRTYDGPELADAAGQGHAGHSRALETATARKPRKNPSTTDVPHVRANQDAAHPQRPGHNQPTESVS